MGEPEADASRGDVAARRWIEGSPRGASAPIASPGAEALRALRPTSPAQAAARPAQYAPAQTPPRVPAAGSAGARSRGGCGVAALVLVALAVFGIGLLLAGYAIAARDLPQPDELQARVSQFSSTIIYDRNGGVLNEAGDPLHGRRTVVPLDKISRFVVDGTIATEDPNFYNHPGVDPVGIARAVYYAIRAGDVGSGPGGSTITQQLVKLTFLSAEKTLTRKVKEAILAAEITRRYPKDKILEIYLNEIYYGNLAYGIEAAAETYFGKAASELTLAEAALLAGLPQAPAYYDPYTRLWDADGQPGIVKERQGVVLRLMAARGYITSEQADAAWKEPLALKPLQQVYALQHPHFVLYARGLVEQTLGPELAAKGGLRIHTTLDPRLQDVAEQQAAAQVAKLGPQGAHNAAVVALRPETGEVLALVGSADFENAEISGQINMAISPRQPGSAMKPLVYLATFEMPPEAPAEPPTAAPTTPGAPSTSDVSAIEPPGYWTASTALMDIRTAFPDGANPPYVPSNYDDKEHGLVSVRTALANSLNIPAVKALQHAGLDRLKDVARRAGITTLTRADYGLSLALGGGDVTLLELTGAYATLANGGVRAEVSPVACVLDSAGRLIWRGAAAESVAGCLGATQGPATTVAVTPAAPQNVFSPQQVYLITSILSDAEARRPMFGGAAASMTLSDRPAAVKTGTTNGYVDGWTMGYTPDLAVGVWVGNADYKPMQKLAGSIGAAPIWHAVMVAGHEGIAPRGFDAPDGMQRVSVCADSGTLPSVACPAQRTEFFTATQGPLGAAYDLHQRVRIDRLTGQLANELTPADRIEERDVMIFPEKYRAWAEAHGYLVLGPQQPGYAFAPELSLESPAMGETVTGVVTVVGRVRIPAPLVWRLEYGVGPNPLGWGVLSGPNPADPNDASQRELAGELGFWDSDATAGQHGTSDFSLRLAAYDPANLESPVAVSNAVYVYATAPLVEPTITPTETLFVEDTPTPTTTPVPTAEATPSPTATESPTAPPPTLEPTATPTVPVPGAVRAAILSPVEGETVTGEVIVTGVADGAGFASYRLQYAAGVSPADGVWLEIVPPTATPVTGATLGTWNTAGLAPGQYTLRVIVTDQGGGSAFADVHVNVVG